MSANPNKRLSQDNITNGSVDLGNTLTEIIDVPINYLVS